MEIDDLGYVEEMRQRLGVAADDTRKDAKLLAMKPMQRVKLISGWILGDEQWAVMFKNYFESQGLYITTDPEAKGIVTDSEV